MKPALFQEYLNSIYIYFISPTTEKMKSAPIEEPSEPAAGSEGSPLLWHRFLNIQGTDFKSIILDEFPTGLYFIPHQNCENFIRIHHILHSHLE